MAEVLETLMLISFGFSWPMNIVKSLKTRSTKGKSLTFMILIEIGYACGIIAKILRYAGAVDKGLWIFSFAVYVLNFLMVGTDMILYFINHTRETHKHA